MKTIESKDDSSLTLLLGRETFVTPKAYFWFLITVSVSFVLIGINALNRENAVIYGSSKIVMGAGLMLYWLAYFTDNPFSPKLIIKEDKLHIKTGLRSTLKTFKASEIDHLEFRSYEVIVVQQKQTQTLKFNINSATSIELKKYIRSWAKTHHIPVQGG